MNYKWNISSNLKGISSSVATVSIGRRVGLTFATGAFLGGLLITFGNHTLLRKPWPCRPLMPEPKLITLPNSVTTSEWLPPAG